MNTLYDNCYVAVGALIEQDGKILLVKENAGLDRGKWSHPAGWLDLAENPVEAVCREVREETGLEFTPSAVLGIYSNVRKDLEPVHKKTPHPVKIMFRGELKNTRNERNTSEIAEVNWFLPEEIEKMTQKDLRHIDIKKQVKDYLSGKSYPLDLITHTIQVAQ